MEKHILSQIHDASIEVHQLLGGPGLLETVYETALCHELSLRGFRCQRQLPIPVTYKNVTVRTPLYLDILVNEIVVIEVKATGMNYSIYQVQLLTYLRLTGLKFGVLVDFGKEHVKEGILHVTNNQIMASSIL